MMTRSAKKAVSPLLLAAMTAPAFAQNFNIEGGEINISGATLFVDFFRAKAATNDWIDVNNNGIFGANVEQLAADYVPGEDLNTWWLFQYRSVGSVNGLNEFVDWQLCRELPEITPSEAGLLNRYLWADLGVIVGEPPYCGPTGTPYCPTSIDASGTDVPTKWAVRSGSETLARWNLKPTTSGYGYNPRTSRPAPGTNGGQSNLLATLERDCAPNPDGISLNTNTNNPDSRTVFDTPVAWVPVCYIANRGTGVEALKVTEFQHLFVTGRMPNGENLAGATRDTGSGTHNAVMNPSGIDPSWGNGDNRGLRINDTTFTDLGPNHQINNCGGSGIIEDAVQNRRLAVGYTGLGGSSRAARDASRGFYEVVGTINDHVGGTQVVRPTIDNVLDNANPNTGYRIGASFTFGTLGDPTETDPMSVTYMDNQDLADFLNNITTSLVEFDPNLPGSEDDYSPAQFLATAFFLEAGLDAVSSLEEPTLFIDQTGSPNFSQPLQNFIRANNGLGWGGDTPAYGSANIAGLVPDRAELLIGSYSDGSTNGDYFYDDAQGNQQVIVAGKKLSERNALQGDFEYDSVRDMDDLNKMVEAFFDVDAFEAGINWGGDAGEMVADVVIVTVIGDHNGDGNFDKEDVRYAADGLAIDANTGKLNRKTGFTRVDQAWQALTGNPNFFGTQLASGRPYQAGASRADVAGADYTAPGAEPVGFDGIVDGKDIAYVQQYARQNVNWANLNSAVLADLSADINGDLLINSADVQEILDILCTIAGDANTDGKVNQADLTIVNANLGNAGGWAEGDFNGNGTVDQADRDTCIANQGFMSDCPGIGLVGPIPGIAGRSNRWEISSAVPGSRVYLVYGFRSGNTPVPGCPGLVVNIQAPEIAGFANANASGNATFTANVPGAAAGRTILFQVADPAACDKSDAISFRFQ